MSNRPIMISSLFEIKTAEAQLTAAQVKKALEKGGYEVEEKGEENSQVGIYRLK
jgi:hypothetical protein